MKRFGLFGTMHRINVPVAICVKLKHKQRNMQRDCGTTDEHMYMSIHQGENNEHLHPTASACNRNGELPCGCAGDKGFTGDREGIAMSTLGIRYRSPIVRKRDKIIEYARVKYAVPSDNNLEIDDKPKLSRGDNGTWVAAWVWISDDEV